MHTYRLYLESGPRRKKTMVHVTDLLGCIANGPTTEIALDRTEGAIRDFLRFLQRYGDPVDPDEPIETLIAEHVMDGVFLGQGDPSIVFPVDLEPLSEAEGETLMRRLGWMHQEVVELVGGLSEEEREQKPAKGRSIEHILEHVLGSEVAYMAAFGRLPGLPAPGSIVTKREIDDLLEWMWHVREAEFERLRALNPTERAEPFIHWKYTRSAHKVMRRMLEHQWEHLVEMRERLNPPAV